MSDQEEETKTTPEPAESGEAGKHCYDELVSLTPYGALAHSRRG
jgi:hypothetical protein